jgi:nucleotide-binding universal stress UspA family protein
VQITAEIGNEFKVFLEAFGDHPGKIRCVTEEGSPQTVMRNQIAKLQANLVIVGTHGRTGLPRAILGSVAENLLGTPPCDIAVVRAW